MNLTESLHRAVAESGRPVSESMADELFMTAEEAARELGVSVPTLYAYVSRKSLRSEKAPGSRARRYWRSDIQRLKTSSAHVVKEPSATLCAQSAITLITATGPNYRGKSAMALAETATLEDVATLLWRSQDPALFQAPAPRPPTDMAALRVHLAGLGPADRAISLFPLLERVNHQAFNLSPEGFNRTGVDVLRWFAAILMDAEPTDEPIHAFVARHAPGPVDLSDLIRRLLVLSADHELDPTTYAVRAAANTEVTPYRAVIAGFTAAMGRRLTFGRAQGLLQLTDEIMTATAPEQPIHRRVQEGDALPGFSNRLYPEGDPRARALLASLSDTFGDDAELMRLQKAIAAVADATGLQPDFSLPNAFVARKMKMNFGLMYLGRIVGWLAHAAEQYQTNPLKRPRATYVGPAPEAKR